MIYFMFLSYIVYVHIKIDRSANLQAFLEYYNKIDIPITIIREILKYCPLEHVPIQNLAINSVT